MGQTGTVSVVTPDDIPDRDLSLLVRDTVREIRRMSPKRTLAVHRARPELGGCPQGYTVPPPRCFIFSSVVDAKISYCISAAVRVLPQLGTASPSHAPEDLFTKCESIIVVHPHAGMKCLFTDTLTDGAWVYANKTLLVTSFYAGYTWGVTYACPVTLGQS